MRARVVSKAACDPLEDLGGDRRRLQAQPGADIFLHLWGDVGEAAHRPRELAHGDILAGRRQPLTLTQELLIPEGEFQTQSGGLGMNPVGPAHHHDMAVLICLGGQDCQQSLQAGIDEVHGLNQLATGGGVHHIGGGEAVVDVPGLGPQALGHTAGKGDDIVAGGLLQFQNPLEAEAGLGPDFLHRRGGNLAQPGPGLTGQDLHLQPQLELILQGPNPCHLGRE